MVMRLDDRGGGRGLVLLGLLALAAGAGCKDDGGGDAASTTGGSADDGADDGDDGSTGAGSDDGTGDETGEPGIDVDPFPGGLRRLLSHQYTGTIEMMLGPDAAAAAAPPADPSIGTYDAMATLESVPSTADVEVYELSSANVADAAIANKGVLAQTVPCVTSGPLDATCYEAVARQLGRVAWRGPVDDAAVARLVDVAIAGQEFGEGDFDVGLRYEIMAILQSPRFLYMVEVGVPGADGGPRELDGYEIASRVSFFLLGRGPDNATLDLAETGELDTDEGVRALAEALVQTPAAHPQVHRFFGEYLRIRELPSKGKSTELFPLFSEALATAMIDETTLLVEDVVFQQDASVLGLFDADYTYVNDVIAPLYGVEAPGGTAWAKVTLPEVQQRAGILTQAGWLAMMSHTDVNSPTRRGLFVTEQMLCTEIPPPPPRVNPEPIVPDPNQTLREALEVHMTDPTCATCHALTDPIGFAFESYDAIGAFRHLDNGKPVDATGDVEGIGAFDGAKELVALLKNDPRIPGCLVENVYTQGIGHVPDEGIEEALFAVETSWGDADLRMKQLLVELAASPVFRLVDEPQ